MSIQKIAVPLADGKLAAHFGHCGSFAILTADDDSKTIVSKEEVIPPPHEPGLLPKWLSGHGVHLVIAGGMGSRAVNLFNSFGMKVLTGAPPLPSEELVRRYLEGSLQTGGNECDH